MATFATRLAQLREKRKMSQAQLAKELKVSNGTIGNYENGSRFPRGVDALCNIADYFNVELDYLIGRDIKAPQFTLEEQWIIDCYRNISDANIKESFKTLLRQYDPLPEEKEEAPWLGKQSVEKVG